MINLWTLIILPIFDYAICFAKLKDQASMKKYITRGLGQNTLFNRFNMHNVIITPQHLQNLHNIEKVLKISELLKMGYNTKKS